MKINIWSDVRCPFCYIGKRKFETALEQFPHKDDVEVVWRSFQLDPELETQPGLHVYKYLADIKGLTQDQAEEMHHHVKQVAEEVGLDFNFDKVVVANSFNAHRLIQFAKAKDRGGEAEEMLFKAHFTDGRNIDDRDTLVDLGVAIGLPGEEVKRVVESDLFSKEVGEDEMLGRRIGIRGVPFFLMNDKLAVSGAQAPEVFLQALQKAWTGYSNG